MTNLKWCQCARLNCVVLLFLENQQYLKQYVNRRIRSLSVIEIKTKQNTNNRYVTETGRPIKLSGNCGSIKKYQIKAMIENQMVFTYYPFWKTGTGKTATANVIATEVLGDVKKSNFLNSMLHPQEY